MTRHHFKSVDQLVEYCEKTIKSPNHNEYTYLLIYFPADLIKILKRKFISPSKYDLTIIRTISEIGRNTFKETDFQIILDIYRKRKV